MSERERTYQGGRRAGKMNMIRTAIACGVILGWDIEVRGGVIQARIPRKITRIEGSIRIGKDGRGESDFRVETEGGDPWRYCCPECGRQDFELGLTTGQCFCGASFSRMQARAAWERRYGEAAGSDARRWSCTGR